MPKKDFERRAYKFDVRAERREDGTSRLSGQPIVYSSPTDIGGWFREVIEPGALDGANLKDVPLLVNHNERMIPVARSRNNTSRSTMRLTIVPTGLEFEADIDTERNMTARELDSAVERGDLDGMSFAFSVEDEEWDDLQSDYPTRHIKRFGAIAEVSACTWPAYTTTSISARGKEALESARSALESARQQQAGPPEGGEEINLLKAKLKLIGGTTK